ncbi:MAG: TIM barrel protein [Prevotellaceae bacterium]|nr:TIM barrel protein [Prevotellaceae bacterium]
MIIAAGTIIPDAVMAQPRYQIGVCDWMVLKRQKIGEFKLAKELGCDGIEMDMGGLGKREMFDNKMRDPKMVELFTRTADSLDIKVGAVAMSGFYGQSFAKRDNYKALVEDCINTMEVMNANVAFLPLGGCGNNWTDSLPLRNEIVRRLHEVGEMAKAQGKVIGIDTPLDAKGNIKLLKEIDSDGIRIFYKFQTAIENNRDICKEIKKLGKKRICAIHASNTDGVWIRNDKAIDMVAIKKALDKIGWSGWLFVERSRDVNDVRNVKKNYGENVKYLKEILQ